MKVAKFGGSSLANASQIKKVVDIIMSDKERHIVVVSAPGKRTKDDTKITDLLITLGETVLSGKEAHHELKMITDRFKEIIEELNIKNELLDEITDIIKKRMSKKDLTNGKFIDSIKALGEDITAKIVAAYIETLGVDVKYVNPKDAGLIMSEEFANATVLDVSYKNLSKLKNEKSLLIFPGFFGYTQKGDIVTFPRGGSDITGSILAKATEADLYENFTDVDSVFAASPSIIDNPKPIEEFTYREMRELSYGGFNVIHAEALQPVYEANIPVHILNTNNPSAKGTKIVAIRKKDKSPVVGVAGDGGFSCIYVSKYLMNREIGFGRKLLNILENENISYEHTPSGIDNISVIVKSHYLTEEIEKRITKRIKEELNVDSVYIEHGFALIMIVGEGMQESLGVAVKTMEAFTKSNINIEMINQGASEVSIMISIKESDMYRAVKGIYNTFFEN